MFFPRSWDAGRRGRQPLTVAGSLALIVSLNTPLDLADGFKIFIHPALVHSGQVWLQPGGFAGDPVENAAIRLTACRAFVSGTSNAKQLVKNIAGISHHRQRLRG